MDITGFWKVSEANVFDKSFKQSWRTVEDIAADPEVNPMQKAMSRAAYAFEADGTVNMLMPKELDPSMETYNDEYGISKKTEWKEEGGKLFIAAEENGGQDWQEIVPAGDAIELFGYHRAVRV